MELIKEVKKENTYPIGNARVFGMAQDFLARWEGK
jgi:hypothetical protein